MIPAARELSPSSVSLELETVACDLCGERRTRERYRKPDKRTWLADYEFRVVECVSCGLVFVNPRPTRKQMTAFYADAYHEGRDSERHLRRYRHQMAFLPSLAGKRVLDVGCARGDFLSYVLAQEPRVEVVGIDAYSSGVKDRRIEFHRAELVQCGLAAFSFDVVMAWAVLEHVHQPSEYFREVHRVLKPGGQFIFLVTNSESFFGRYAFREDVPRHTYHFSKPTLTRYAERFGFRLRSCAFDDSIFDGRGHGTFRWALARAAGVTWDKVRRQKFSFIERAASRLGVMLDKAVFSTHWESRLQRSGIIVVQFEKQP